ncbi:MAG TPA: twin-arginine translocase TatA/TatE family subunit [Candidatus Dormibacteraeota bacterium]|jgi:TatA/E family protein of Tat protein translocase|nr:twin-arginine translocase TatA/TatE family subunit [Candidatus Dormibacteraeota bacterium]
MAGFGTGHIWLIAILLIIVLIIWGPGKLPDVGAGLGRAIREFRKASSETRDEFTKATRYEDPAPTAAAPVIPTPEAPAPATPVQPAPVGGGSATAPATQPAAGEGDHTSPV